MAGAWDESRDAAGLPTGMGAPPVHQQIAAGVPRGASGTQAWTIVYAYEQERRQNGQVPYPVVYPSVRLPLRAFGRWLLYLAVAAIPLSVWKAPSWYADADVRTRADLVRQASSRLELAPWERFAGMAAPGARMNLSQNALAAAIRKAGAPGVSPRTVAEHAALGSAALFCMTGRSECIERVHSVAGMSDDSRTIAHAALAFLESPAARAANADLAASQRAVMCTKLLGFRIGFTWNDCRQGLDSKVGPLTAGVASEFNSIRMRLLRYLLPR